MWVSSEPEPETTLKSNSALIHGETSSGWAVPAVALSARPPACRLCGQTGSFLGVLSGQGEQSSQNLQIPFWKDPSSCGQRYEVQEEATHGDSSIPQQGPRHPLQKLRRHLSPPRMEGAFWDEGDHSWQVNPEVNVYSGMAQGGVPESCGGLTGKEVSEWAVGGLGPLLTWPSALPGPSAPALSAAAAPGPAPAEASLSWSLLSASGAPPLYGENSRVTGARVCSGLQWQRRRGRAWFSEHLDGEPCLHLPGRTALLLPCRGDY